MDLNQSQNSLYDLDMNQYQNVTSLSEFKNKMYENTCKEFVERRKIQRKDSNGKAFIQVLNFSSSETLSNQILVCQMKNISKAGIQFIVSEEVLVDSDLDLWVEVSDYKGKIFLTATAKWCYQNPLKSDEWFLGVQIIPNKMTDYSIWLSYCY